MGIGYPAVHPIIQLPPEKAVAWRFSVKTAIRATFYFAGMLVLALPAYSQNCAPLDAIQEECSGPNGCEQTAIVNVPGPFGQLVGLEPSDYYCCDDVFQDYTGWECIPFENGSVRHEAMEFAMTHTLWVEDCSGHFGPFTRSEFARNRPIKLRPKLKLN